MANNLTDIYVGVKKNDPNRTANDFYPTPPLATYILCKYGNVPHKVIEPCAGRGHISSELLRNGHDVISYDLNVYPDSLVDINTPYDALELPKDKDVKGVITNPPYHKNLPHKLAEKWTEEYDYTAMFLRLTFLEGKKRNKLFTNNPPSDIIYLSDRVKFDSKILEPVDKTEQIGGMIAYMWIIWDKKAKHKYTRCQWAMLEDEYNEWKLNYDKRKNENSFYFR